MRTLNNMEPPTKKRKQYPGTFQSSWNSQFQGVVTASKLGSNHAWCTVCCKDLKVAASGVYDVREHIKSKAHERQVKCPQVTSFFKPKRADSADSTTRAEVLFSYFVAEHNLPASLGDHFTELSREMFPDSEIAKRFKCKRTKTTQIVKRCLATAATKPVVERCRNGPFSIMIDESTDRKTEKRLVVLVRYFDFEQKAAQTRLLDMPVCNGGTSNGIFNVMDGVLRYFFVLFHYIQFLIDL